MRHIEKNCGVNNMGFIERLERNIARLEKRIEKERIKIEHLHEKCESKKITKADFNIKKMQIEAKIHSMNSRIRVLQGGMTKEKKHQEEKAKEKQKEKEEKAKEKEKKKK